MSDTADERQQALGRIQARRGFWTAAAAYLIINAFLWIVWAVGDNHSGVPWPLWVTLGWGLGMAFLAWKTFGEKSISESEIQREMGRGKDSPASS